MTLAEFIEEGIEQVYDKDKYCDMHAETVLGSSSLLSKVRARRWNDKESTLTVTNRNVLASCMIKQRIIL